MLLREKEKHLDLLKVIQDSGQTICSRWMMKMAFIWRYSTMSERPAPNIGEQNKKYNIDLERIGLEKDTEYSVTDMWSGKNMQVKDIMSIELHPEESSIYKIKRGNNR